MKPKTPKPKKRARAAPKADRLADRLLRAVVEYIEGSGGRVVIAGPISLMRFPDDREYVFHVAVKCVGRTPARST